MYERLNTYTHIRPRLRKFIGWTLLVVGFLALVTPLTPGGLLFFVGLELLGFRYILGKRWARFFTPATQKIHPEELKHPL